MAVSVTDWLDDLVTLETLSDDLQCAMRQKILKLRRLAALGLIADADNLNHGNTDQRSSEYGRDLTHAV